MKNVRSGRLLEAEIMGTNKTVVIPRMSLQPTDTVFPFKWKRPQFPVQSAFAITINKAQGQTLKRVGVLLEDDVFTHEQLYVAASRVGDPEQLKFSSKFFNRSFITKNIVFCEVQ